MEEKNKTKEIDIPCACAIGDLSEFAPVILDKEAKKKIQKKIEMKDGSKKEDSNP